MFQLLRIRVPGAPDDATVADVARILYQRGYDFRHYMAGAVVPGLVEGLIRLYDWLRYSSSEAMLRPEAVRSQLAERYVARTQANARLASRLFWAHAIAAGANAGRVALQGATGDFFSAARNVNLAEWQMFALRTIKYVMSRFRDTDLEQAVENRRRLEEKWASLSPGMEAVCVLYESSAPIPASERVLL